MSAPTLLTRTDAAAVDVLDAWHGLALTVADALDRRDTRVPAIVAKLENELGVAARQSDDRWPIVARRFARAHRAAIRGVNTTADATRVAALANDAAMTLDSSAPTALAA